MKKALRNLARHGFKALAILESRFDAAFLLDDVPMTTIVAHQKWQKYLYSIGNKEGLKILEIGSREVTALSDARKQFGLAHYTGFDYYPGHNVDVVGDVHHLSSYFPEGEQFDLIYTSACFEHFAMPWLVSPEIAKMLKVGGILFVETHFAFRAHERPWNFFQFSDMGLRVLFPAALGFECIEAGLSNSIVGRFSASADKYLRLQPISGLYCHSEYLGRKVREITDFKWEQVSLDEVVSGTVYPPPKS